MAKIARLLLALLASLVLLAAGYLAPWLLVSSRLDAYSGIERRVAADALVLSGVLRGHPLPQLLTTARSVVEVRREPGSCLPGDPSPGPPIEDYVAVVQAYTFFGLPFGRREVACGGWRLGARERGDGR